MTTTPSVLCFGDSMTVSSVVAHTGRLLMKLCVCSSMTPRVRQCRSACIALLASNICTGEHMQGEAAEHCWGVGNTKQSASEHPLNLF